MTTNLKNTSSNHNRNHFSLVRRFYCRVFVLYCVVLNGISIILFTAVYLTYSEAALGHASFLPGKLPGKKRQQSKKHCTIIW